MVQLDADCDVTPEGDAVRAQFTGVDALLAFWPQVTHAAIFIAVRRGRVIIAITATNQEVTRSSGASELTAAAPPRALDHLVRNPAVLVANLHSHRCGYHALPVCCPLPAVQVTKQDTDIGS